MSMPEGFDPSSDVKILWVKPESEPSRGASKVLDEERQKPPAERAEVFAIDLSSTDVPTALEWAKRYRAGLGPEDPPPCLVVYGREIEPEVQVQFAQAGIHALDVYRNELPLQGPNSGMLLDLLRSVVMAHSVAGMSPAPPRPAPSSGDWALYTTQPSHVPETDLNSLFNELARDDRDWWERDF
jgi:hypothetical protein